MRQLNWISKFLILSSSLFAVSPCCPPCALDRPSCTGERYTGICGELFSSDPCGPCGMIWTTHISALAWQAFEEGLNFAVANHPLELTASTNVNGDLVGIDFDWEPAVKIELGVSFPDRSWDTNLRWTYFHTHSSHTEHLAANIDSTGLLPMWAFPNAQITTQFLYGAAEGSWNLNLNTFDIEMGYHPLLTPALAFRFIAGLKISSIHQRFLVHYSDGLDDGDHTLIDAKTAIKNNSVGAGPRIGFDSKWKVGQGFSLLANFTGSLPLLRYEVERKDNTLGLDVTTLETIDSFFKEGFWIFRPILEASLGLGWDTCFGCRSQFPFGISASYEFQYYAEQNMMAMLINPGINNVSFLPRGDLHIHGATFTFHFGF